MKKSMTTVSDGSSTLNYRYELDENGLVRKRIGEDNAGVSTGAQWVYSYERK